MQATTMVRNSLSELPPGFRFHPTDEELIVYYLKNQAASKPCHVSFILEIDIYKFDPWQLPEKSEVGENEWYFFSPRDRKYPNGVRPNRATVSGYWKATGTDKAIHSGPKLVGVKKALVFYTGRPPRGVKTDWIMHEYRLNEPRGATAKQDGSMRLDDWVLCRIYKKKHAAKGFEMGTDVAAGEKMGVSPSFSEEQGSMKVQRNCSLTHLLQFEYGQFSQLLGDDGMESQLLEGSFGSDYFEECPFYQFVDGEHVGYGFQ